MTDGFEVFGVGRDEHVLLVVREVGLVEPPERSEKALVGERRGHVAGASLVQARIATEGEAGERGTGVCESECVGVVVKPLLFEQIPGTTWIIVQTDDRRIMFGRLRILAD